MVSSEGVGTDQSKVEAVMSWPVPKNVNQVRSFLGLCSYYRRFIRHFADIARPLHKLTEVGIKFDWSDACQKLLKS